MFRFLAASLLAMVAVAPLARAEDPQPIKVLWCTGGASHDYKGLQPILTKGIQKQSSLPISFTPSTDPKEWAKKGFADKYDLIVLFFTQHDPAGNSAGEKPGKAIAANIAQTIHDGKPAVVIHGTLHSYRELNQDRDAFCEAMGLTSVRHDTAGSSPPRRSPIAGSLPTGRPIGRPTRTSCTRTSSSGRMPSRC